MPITLHLARAANGVIGVDGRLPWHIPADLKRFKAQTMGRAMVMGRKTFESFPAPLPGRRHIVLTRDPDWTAAGAEVAHSLDAALALPHAERIELTEVHREYAGDAVVPPFAGWREVAREDFAAEGDRPAFSFVGLMRA